MLVGEMGGSSSGLANEFAGELPDPACRASPRQGASPQLCSGLCLRSPRGEWPKKRL